MAMGKLTLCFALLASTGTATAQPASTPENWTPVSHNAQSVTGQVTLTPSEITFQNGKSWSLTSGGQMLFRPEPKKKEVAADLYKVTSPSDAIPLCKGKAEGQARAKANGKYRGRPEDARRNAGIATMLEAGISWSAIQDATGCGRATVAKIAARLRDAA